MKTLPIMMFLLIALAFINVQAADESKQVATVTAVRGECLKGLDQAQLKPAAKGSPVMAGSWLKTGKKSFMEIQFIDSNSFRLKSQTEARLESLGELSKKGNKVIRLVRLDLISGETGVKLSKLPPGYMVEVSTPAAIAGASGTGFSVALDKIKSSSVVKVFESAVDIVSRDNRDKHVLAQPMQQVESFPWSEGWIKGTGHGILSERLLGHEFIKQHRYEPEQIKIIASGSAEIGEDTAVDQEKIAYEEATADARSSMAGIVIPMHINDHSAIADLLKNNPELTKKVYEIIAESKITDQNIIDNIAEVTVQIDLTALSNAIGKDMTAVLATVEQISKKEYRKKFGNKAYLTTKRAAEADGHRRLAEKLYGSVIDAATTMRDLADKDNQVKITIKGVVQGAEIAAERYFADGSIALDLASSADGIQQQLGPEVGQNFLSSAQPVMVTDFAQYQALAD
jgi:hypothetical protein